MSIKGKKEIYLSQFSTGSPPPANMKLVILGFLPLSINFIFYSDRIDMQLFINSGVQHNDSIFLYVLQNDHHNVYLTSLTIHLTLESVFPQNNWLGF